MKNPLGNVCNDEYVVNYGNMFPMECVCVCVCVRLTQHYTLHQKTKIVIENIQQMRVIFRFIITISIAGPCYPILLLMHARIDGSCCAMWLR